MSSKPELETGKNIYIGRQNIWKSLETNITMVINLHMEVIKVHISVIKEHIVFMVFKSLDPITIGT